MDLEISVFENIKCGHCRFLYKNIHTNKNLSSEMALEDCSVRPLLSVLKSKGMSNNVSIAVFPALANIAVLCSVFKFITAYVNWIKEIN